MDTDIKIIRMNRLGIPQDRIAGPQVVEKHGWTRTHVIPALLRHCFVQRIGLGMALQECNSLKSVKM